MSVFSNIINGVREAARQSTGLVTSAKGFKAVQAARASAAAVSASTVHSGEKAAFTIGVALGRGAKTLAYSLKSNFITSLVALEVTDFLERAYAKRTTKKEIRDLTEYLARTSALNSDQALLEREKDVKRLVLLEETLPKRRSFRKFLSDLPTRIVRRVVRAAKTAIGTTGVVFTAPLALGVFAVDLLWRVGVMVPITVLQQVRGKEFDSTRWTKFTGAALVIGIKPFFYFLKVAIDGMTMRTWLESKDVQVMEDLEEAFAEVRVCTEEEQQLGFVNGFENVRAIRFTDGSHKASMHALLVRRLWEHDQEHQYLTSYFNGAREATPWWFKDLVTP